MNTAQGPENTPPVEANKARGARIRTARKTKGFSTLQLGQALGCDRNTVYRWEWGSVAPHVNDLVRLAGALDVTVGWLANGEGDGPVESAESPTD